MKGLFDKLLEELFKWLRGVFCGSIISKLEKCRETIGNVGIQNDELRAEVEAKDGEIERLKALNDALQRDKKALREDADYFKHRMDEYAQMLEASFTAPDISGIIADAEMMVIDPYEVIVGYDDFIAADLEYYAFEKAVWEQILTPVQVQVKKALEKWKRDISDCDNFSDVMAAFVGITFVKAGLDKQGAFLQIWDMIGLDRHSYNAFVDLSGTTWIYEPQTNEVVGRLGETTGLYESNIIWFPGEKPREK